MKSGDIILNVKNRLTVTFKGWIAGEVSGYQVKLDDQVEDFKGTVAGVLKHSYEKIEVHNKNCMILGGTIL